MNPIILTDFLGEVPLLDVERLPEAGAQLASDCQLRGGVIKPVVIGNPISQLWSGSTLSPLVTSADVFEITKPAAPTLVSRDYLCNPEAWLQVVAYDWYSEIRQSDGVRITVQLRGDALDLVNVVYTETGMWLVYKLLQRYYDFVYGGPYFLSGPKFRFIFAASPGMPHNGPSEEATYPQVAGEFDPQWPSQRVPLEDERGNIYAEFECVDAYAPDYSTELLVTSHDSIRYYVPGQAALGGYSYVAFKINLNYAQPNRRHFYYVQANLIAGGGPDEYFEGPPSELSARITVKPGQLPVIGLAGAPVRLYRSQTGHDDFLKLDDITSGSTFEDYDDEIEGIEIPPYGNPRDDFAPFTYGAFWHPAHFVACLYDENLYLSDTFRGWSFPDEFSLPFPDAFAHILTGNTILVFTTSRVWAVVGNQQESMLRYVLSSEHPLLSVKGLGRIGNLIFWPTYDGLAMCDGNSVEIITRAHFGRQEWGTYTPATMTLKTADNAVLIECADGTKWRLDLDGQEKALTRWTSTSPAGFTWTSKRFWHREPVIYDYVLVASDQPVTLTVYQDGAQTWTEAINDATPVPLTGLDHSRGWEFKFEGTAALRRFEAHERVVTTVEDSARLTAENTPVWRSTWMKFQDQDRFALGVLSAQSGTGATVQLYVDGTQRVTNLAVTSGRPFVLDRLSPVVPKGTLLRLSVESDATIDELLLYRRRVQAVGESLNEVNDGPVAPWRIKRYEFDGDRVVRSIVVHASSYPVTLNLYADGADTATRSVSITSRAEARLTADTYGFLEFDFGADDGLVHEVSLYAPSVQPVPEGGIDLGTGPVRGRVFRFAEPHNFSCALIGLSSYASATLTLYADGVSVYSAAVTSGQAFLLPRTLARGLLWEVDLATTAEVDTCVLVPWRREQTDSIGLTHLAGDGRIPPWMYTIYEFPAPVRIRSGIVLSKVYPVDLRLYADGATSASLTQAVADKHEWRVTTPVECRTLSFDFNAATGYDDGDVSEAFLFNEETVPVEGGGVILRPAAGRTAWRNKVLAMRDVGSFRVVRVMASSYTGLVLKLNAGGSDRVTETITSSGDVKVSPGNSRYRDWYLDLAHQGDIRELQLIVDDHYTLDGPAVIIRKEGDPWTWLGKRIMSAFPVNFSCVRVLASAYPVEVKVYADGTLIQTLDVDDEKPVRLQRSRPERLHEFDFTAEAETTVIHEAAVGLSMGSLRV